MRDNSTQIEAVLSRAIEAGVFPGAALHFRRAGETIYRIDVGTIQANGAEVDEDTFYDLASVTKIYTLAAAFQILRSHQISFDTPLNRFLPAFDSRITFRHLMQHSSGIRLHIQSIYESDADTWGDQIAVAPLESEPGTEVFYACTNAFLLGRALVAIEEEKLEVLIRRTILEPNHLRATFTVTPDTVVAPTEEQDDGAFLRGIVHDEAARSYWEQSGDCVGNSGLFSTASDVADFSELWSPSRGFFHPDDLSQILHSPLIERGGLRGLGWQIGARSWLSDSCPPKMLSHLGFTGPMLAFDMASQTSLVLLCNRVYPNRNGPDRRGFFQEIATLCFATSA